MTEDEMLDELWVVFRHAIKEHIEAEAKEPPRSDDTEAKYRQRCEKAGISRIVRYVIEVTQ